VLARTSTEHDRKDRDGTGTNTVFHLRSPLADGTGTGCDAFFPAFALRGRADSYFIDAGVALWTSMPSSMKQPNDPLASGA
jgi:hypothetical protein